MLQDNNVDCDSVTCPGTVTKACGSLVADTAIQMTGAQHDAAQASLARLSTSKEEASTAMGVPISDVGAITANVVVAGAQPAAKSVVEWGFEVAADAYDPATSPAAYAAALAAKMGDPFTAADFTVTAVQNADGTWSVSVALDAGDNAVAAHIAAKTLSATTPAELAADLGLENTVSFGFEVAADAYDPSATSGPTSPAAYAAALAAKMGRPFKASDFTVTAVQNADGTWSVSVEVDAGDDAAAAQSAADNLSATTPAELASALGLPAGSVSSITPATVAVETAEATVSWSFDVVGDSYDPDAYAAALATALGDPFTATDITVTAVQGPGGIWSVSVVVDAGTDGAAALRAKAVLNSMTPARLAEVLGAEIDGNSIGTASIEVQYGQSSSAPSSSPTAGLPDSGASNQTTADEGPMIGGIIGGAILILLMLVLVYVLLKKRDEKAEAAAWLKSENAKVAGPVIVTETPGEAKPTSPKPTSPGSPKASPALQSWLKEAGDDEAANFSGDDDEPKSPRSPGSPKSPSQIFV